jgi:cell division protein FtsI/penicillin-binding protein 2
MLLNRLARKGDSDGCILLAVIFIFFGLPFIVCGVNAYVQEQRKTEVAKAEAATKIAEEEASRRAVQERSGQRFTISGTIKTIQFSKPSTIEWTRVVFEDGREKTFGGLSTKPVKAGDNVTITFDGNDRIATVEVN